MVTDPVWMLFKQARLRFTSSKVPCCAFPRFTTLAQLTSGAEEHPPHGAFGEYARVCEGVMLQQSRILMCSSVFVWLQVMRWTVLRIGGRPTIIC